jgi:uncharacterized OB-fold protein
MAHRVSTVTALVGLLAAAVTVVSLVGVGEVLAGGYEKSQTTVQTNECGNYWFPVNVICSNLGSQVKGDENNVAMATNTESASSITDSKTNYGPPFP